MILVWSDIIENRGFATDEEDFLKVWGSGLVKKHDIISHPSVDLLLPVLKDKMVQSAYTVYHIAYVSGKNGINIMKPKVHLTDFHIRQIVQLFKL